MNLKTQFQSLLNPMSKPSSSSTNTKMPSWLEEATSQKHVSAVLRQLASRESTRHAARTVSQQNVPRASAPRRSKPSMSAGPFWRQEDVDPNHVAYYSIAKGVHEDHEDMNRYGDVVPYDRTGLVVKEGCPPPPAGAEDQEGVWHGRYLNANWVLERYGHKWWIATQAPLRYTAHAFLSVLLQPSVQPPQTSDPGVSSPSTKTNRVRTVVQLTRNIEGGRRKADSYFPTEVGQSLVVLPEEGCHASALKVTLLEKTHIEEAHCIHSTVSIARLQKPETTTPQAVLDESDYRDAKCGPEVVFNHFLYLSWPDHGVPDPEDRDSLLTFITLVDTVNRDKSRCPVHPSDTPNHLCEELDADPPIMVGCSAGIGRTGSFLAISSLLRHFGFIPPAAHPTTTHPVHNSPLGPIPADLQTDLVLQEIDSLREQRPGMVQRSEQVFLVYETLINAFNPIP